MKSIVITGSTRGIGFGLDDPEGFVEAKRIFNILGDRVETVTPWLADKVLANEKSGARFAWLTPGLVLWRFATARFHQRELFD
jgi:hypothetical protein